MVSQVHSANTTDPYLLHLHEQFQQGKLPPPYSVDKGILYFNGRFVLNTTSPLITLLLQEFHDTPSGGHAGIKRTLVRLAAIFFFARNATVGNQLYISMPHLSAKSKEPLQFLRVYYSLSLFQRLFRRILQWILSLPLPVSQGMSTILVMVDRLSKCIHLEALPANFTAAKVAELFVEIVIKNHGFPKSIISDRDPFFVSTFWRCLFELSGTKLSMSSSYHPQTDGKTEVVNRGLEQYLRAFVQDNPKTWLFFLCWAEFHYNSSSHSSLKMSPFQALYGHTPPTIPYYTRTSSSIQAVDDILTQRDQLL